MAKKFRKMASIKDTEGGNFGQYEESNGGGTPKGGVWGGTDGRVGWEKRKKQGEVKEGENRQEQPRTADGKFTYNSVNGKETVYESRGETVNPLLTNGENGVYIKDHANKRGSFKEGVETQFQNKSGELYDKYKDKWATKGAEKITKEGKKFHTVIAKENIFEIARRSFDIKTGMFEGEAEQWSEKKKGAPSNIEKAARKEAQKSGQETYVKTPTGAIAIKGDSSAANFKKALGKANKSSLKHTPEQIQQVRDIMAQQGQDISQATDEQIDQIMDQYFTIS